MPGSSKLDRNSMIYALLKTGMTYEKISKQINVPVATVGRIALKCKKNEIMERKRGSGRRSSLDQKDLEFIKTELLKNPKISAPKLNGQLQNVRKKHVSDQTVRNALHSLSFFGRVARKVPKLSIKNIKRRYELANEWSNWVINKWNNVLFTDESKFNLFHSDGRVMVWRDVGKELENQNTVKTVKHGGQSLMVWACMSCKGVGNLEFIEGKMDAIKYRTILGRNLIESKEKLGLDDDFVFQQDNDPKHTSKISKEFFKKNNVNVLDWPSQSPDLNPIEHLWAYMKTELSKLNSKNLKELKENIKNIWDNISEPLCRKLVHSMPNRCEAVVRAKGHHTMY